MKKKYLVLAGCLVFLYSTQAAAGEENFGFGLKAGSLGGGVELTKLLTDDLVLRTGVNYLTFSIDSTISGIDYDMEATYKNGNLLLDWHPFSGSFRISGGVFLNGNEVDVDGAVPTDRIFAGYAYYVPQTDLLHVKGNVDFNSIAPYAGIGWKSNHGESGWGLACELGVLFQGSAQVSDLYVQSPVDVNKIEIVQDFLDEQKKAIEDDLDDYQYYPVASIMLMYNF
ncbi:MAG: hypothetical protein KKD01_14000 [Proteobacteria bacterium]|nr:hypothetical protein [Pseudomonadota bacterium]MBU1140397.1 hypothetical protein [Pseudomonadota bacterium]MBU1233879.1 hypothetical protein [Pseudomonadota bacterium]MBU1418641.1 hypothetical protein [Pseudomonadota bacterium]MBU1455834.1 hypothetical protein [Pseudomonadota bacterium]